VGVGLRELSASDGRWSAGRPADRYPAGVDCLAAVKTLPAGGCGLIAGCVCGWPAGVSQALSELAGKLLTIPAKLRAAGSKLKR